jgi:hypothetical protein
MVDNIFRTVITATDNSESVVSKANARWGKFGAGIQNTQSSLKGFGKQSGLDKVGESFGNVTKQARGLLDQVISISAPMAAIAGIGTAAGLAEMARKWGDAGSEIMRTSTVIGMSKQSLQEWRGVAQLAGTSVDGMTEGLHSLGNTLNDAISNRNQGALVAMNKIGLQLHYTKDGAIDTADAFMQLNRAVNMPGRNAHTDETIVNMLGASSLLPILRMSTGQIESYRQEVYKLGMVQGDDAVASADKFAQSSRNLGGALTALGNTISSTLAPAFGPLIDDTTTMISNNQDLIASLVGIAVNASLIVGGVKGVSLLKDAVAGLSLKTAIGAESLAGMLTKIPFIGAAMEWLSGIFLAFGAALEATPIGLIIGGIALLGAGAYELYQHWSDIGRWWHNLWGGMGDDAELGRDRTLKAAGPATSHLRTPAETVGRHFGPAVGPSDGLVIANDVGAAGRDPRGIRNNNPGNLNFVGQAGAGTDGRFATFPTMQAGVDALNHQLKLYESRGVNSVDSIISKFAPANENNTPGYIQTVAKDLGVTPGQKLTLDAPTLNRLDRAIVGVEDGRGWADKIFGGAGGGDSLAKKFGSVTIASALAMPAAAAPAAPMVATIASPSGDLGLTSRPLTSALAPAMAIAAAPPIAGPYSQPAAQVGNAGGLAPQSGAVEPTKVVIEFANAPSGMGVAKISGPGARNIQVKIASRMPSELSP